MHLANGITILRQFLVRCNTRNSERDTELDENTENKLKMQSIHKVSGNEPGYLRNVHRFWMRLSRKHDVTFAFWSEWPLEALVSQQWGKVRLSTLRVQNTFDRNWKCVCSYLLFPDWTILGHMTECPLQGIRCKECMLSHKSVTDQSKVTIDMLQ